MKKLLLLCMAAGLAACGPKNHEPLPHGSGAHTDQGIVISAANVIPPFPGRDVSAGYFEITNHGNDDRLLSIESPISPRVEMHTHLNEDGVMKMRKVDGLDLPTGSTVVFKPGSYHVMMFNVAMKDADKDVALTFNFETAPSVTIIADIDGRSSEGSGEHDGH